MQYDVGCDWLQYRPNALCAPNPTRRTPIVDQWLTRMALDILPTSPDGRLPQNPNRKNHNLTRSAVSNGCRYRGLLHRPCRYTRQRATTTQFLQAGSTSAIQRISTACPVDWLSRSKSTWNTKRIVRRPPSTFPIDPTLQSENGHGPQTCLYPHPNTLFPPANICHGW
jgi:hypothetical protein